MAKASAFHGCLRLVIAIGVLSAFAGAAHAQDVEALPDLPAADPEAPSPSPADSGAVVPPPFMVEEEPFPPGDAPYEPPPPYAYPPGYYYEPPPPPPPAPHVAPNGAFWLGARIGMIVPFGKLSYDDPYGYTGPDWGEYARPGSSFELDAGGRFARRYVVYAFWERGSLGKGRRDSEARARTDLFGAGFRWTSHPDETGLVLDVGLGFRSFRADLGDDLALKAISPIEVRIGIGADIRLGKTFTLSPMMQISNGVFTDVEIETSQGASQSLVRYQAPHGTFGLAIGGHFDLLPSP